MEFDEPVGGDIISTVEGGVASIVISNTARRNALSASMMTKLGRELSRIDEDPRIAVAVIRGAGTTFAAGADLSEFGAGAGSAEARRQSDDAVSALFDALAKLATPLIAVIQGYCIGAGMAVALGADLRVATEDSRFAIPAARLGIGYPQPGVHALVSAVGPARAAEFLFTGDRFTADQALAAGLVNRVVASAELEDAVAKLTQRLVDNAPLSILAAKAAIRAGVAGTPELRAAAEKRLSACAGSSDAIEGRLAFLEKRIPRFTGH